MRSKARIAIIYDQKINGEGLKALLSSRPDWEVIGEVKNQGERIDLLEKSNPHLVLIDHSSRKMNWIPLIQSIKKVATTVKIIVLTEHKIGRYIQATFEAGAEGYAIKDSGYSELQMAIKAILMGNYFFSPAISNRVIQKYLLRKGERVTELSPASLTDRERAVLKLIVGGYNNREISAYLGISINTVIKHRANIMSKFEVHKTSDLISIAKDKQLAE